MKDAPSSRGFAATNSAELSNGSSTETIGTEPETINGSSIGSIDPNDTSFFIQYQPELAEKLSQHTSNYSVSGRCLSIVFSRMLYWSRYSKWRFQGKLWYWKNQTELSEETGFSVKQINRALKVLVELGIIFREKFQKHYYRQVYFYHIPVSPYTKELKEPTRTSSRSRSTRTSPTGAGSQPQQQFHSRSGGSGTRPEAVVVSSAAAGPGASNSTRTITRDRGFGSMVRSGGSGTRPEAVVVSSAAGRSGAPAAAGSGALSGRVQQGVAGRRSTIHQTKEFGSMGTKCPNQSQELQSSIKQSLLDIVEKCKSYGNIEIYRERFGLDA